MATLPKAEVTLEATAGALGAGTDLLCLWSPVATNPDITPRQFGSAGAIYDQHGYSEGVEYAALHAEQTGKPILFVGLPIATLGAVSREDTSGNSGTSVTTVAAGGDGVLAEHDGVLEVETGGTIGTDQIVLQLSMDGGRLSKRVRLGKGTSYTIPYFNVTVSFAAGTLVTGDVIHVWHGSAPLSDATSWIAARTALAAQLKLFRSILLTGDFQTGVDANNFNAQLEAYETANQRYVYGRGSVRDREPEAALSKTTVRMTGNPTVTFADVGATGDTITRSAGSFVTDGFVAGQVLTISGTANNNLTTVPIISVTATVITLDDDTLAAEATTDVTIVGAPSLTFASGPKTITRSQGSWLTDGFYTGASVTFTGTASNNSTFTVTAVTATVLTVTEAVVDEAVGVSGVTAVAGQTKAAWMADVTDAFSVVDDAYKIDLSAGRGRVLSPFSAWERRLPAGWAASLREYQHDLHIATWRKRDGVTGWSLRDVDGNLAEWDDFIDGEAGSAARFTTFRSYANGPKGAFIALSLTRALDTSLMSRTHNVAVVNLAQTICLLNTENVSIGESLELNPDGTAVSGDLSLLANEVNAELENNLLTNTAREGARASQVKWTPASDDILNVAEPLLNGELSINLKGTIHSVKTVTRIASGGQ